ncbi:hypothetical protein JRO89_XS10G0187200 [Xanthoceras sorbifolium]|uniref:Uncharacterized protein n=1 Tax=Xanthoceras sorbifolium TaxID=99658 RepID=A0ABQ8HJD8_9ROSI|nr:hypothetical protein JRO89_XS10G0187200 [Xanthoceras sorbifolium]
MDGFCSNQVSDCCDYKRHGYSKAQACLKKILEIISSIEEAPVRNPSLKSQVGGFSCGKKGFDIDLNLSLVPGPFWEPGEYSTESLVENGDLSATAELISRTESGSASGDKQVMMMSHDDDEIIKNNKKNWRVDEDQDTSAELVRAKRDRRRRSQILPHRYRDSVLLQPWKRLKTAIINPRSRVLVLVLLLTPPPPPMLLCFVVVGEVLQIRCESERPTRAREAFWRASLARFAAISQIEGPLFLSLNLTLHQIDLN